MNYTYLKSVFIVFILISGAIIAPGFCVNPQATNMVEDQMNDNFKNAISGLPEETAKPIQNTLNYIKKKSKCNDWEAAQINALMSVHSNQKQGYDYYARYMAGNTTAEEDNADYYRAIRSEWDNFIKEYAKMTPQQRSYALITSANNEDVEKILNSSSSDEIQFIQSKTKPYENKIETESNKLSSLKSKDISYIVTHADFLKECGDNINKAKSDLNEAIVAADKEWNIDHQDNADNAKNTKSTNSATLTHDPLNFSLLSPNEDEHDEDAYPNALHVANELKKLGQNVSIKNSFSEGKSNIELGDLVQYRISSSNVNKPMYKYLLIKNDTGSNYGIDTLDLIPRDAEGKRIDESGKDISEIHAFQHDRIYIPKSALTSDNTKYSIGVNATGEWRVNELYTAYDTDCTHLNSRLKDIVPMPDKKDKNAGITQITCGIASTIGGITVLVIGIAFIKAAIAAAGPTAGVSLTALVPGLALIFTSLGLLLSGIALIVTGSYAVEKYNDNKESHEKGEKDIFNDIIKHNKYPQSI